MPGQHSHIQCNSLNLNHSTRRPGPTNGIWESDGVNIPRCSLGNVGLQPEGIMRYGEGRKNHIPEEAKNHFVKHLLLTICLPYMDCCKQ